jgi:hypothetical protein
MATKEQIHNANLLSQAMRMQDVATAETNSRVVKYQGAAAMFFNHKAEIREMQGKEPKVEFVQPSNGILHEIGEFRYMYKQSGRVLEYMILSHEAYTELMGIESYFRSRNMNLLESRVERGECRWYLKGTGIEIVHGALSLIGIRIQGN